MVYMNLKRILRLPCGSRCNRIFSVILPVLYLALAVPVTNGEEVSSTHFMSRDQAGVLSVTSSKMTLKNQQNTILFEGDVVVERDNSTLKANNVEVIFTGGIREEGGADLLEKKREISTITAKGDVKFVQGARTILADKVIYYRNEDKMIFSGKPNVHEGQDELKGEKITVFLKEDRVIVEGGEAVIHPR